MNAKQFQALLDNLPTTWQRQRAETQMTLSKMITALNEMSTESLVDAFGHPHRYRGYYYEDLAFERIAGKIPVTNALEICHSAIKEVFQVYKDPASEDFMTMGNIPVWLADRGYLGEKIMGVRKDGTFETAKDIHRQVFEFCLPVLSDNEGDLWIGKNFNADLYQEYMPVDQFINTVESHRFEFIQYSYETKKGLFRRCE